MSGPAAKPFYESVGALPIRTFWYAWDDISDDLPDGLE